MAGKLRAIYRAGSKGRRVYGCEINKEFYRRAKEEMCVLPESAQMEIEEFIS